MAKEVDAAAGLRADAGGLVPAASAAADTPAARPAALASRKRRVRMRTICHDGRVVGNAALAADGMGRPLESRQLSVPPAD
jgi:hypothetical protein